MRSQKTDQMPPLPSGPVLLAGRLHPAEPCAAPCFVGPSPAPASSHSSDPFTGNIHQPPLSVSLVSVRVPAGEAGHQTLLPTSSWAHT